MGSSLPKNPLPSQLSSYYSYTPGSAECTVESTKEEDGYQIKRLRLTPQMPAMNGSDPIVIDWYRPHKPGPLPVALMSPILADDDLYVREFARFYAARGMHGVLVYRPHEVFSAGRSLEDIELHFKESIIQMRQTLDWLETQDSVDREKIGTFAISLGAILTTILAAVEPRVKASVLGLPAGEVAEVIMTSKDKAIRKRRNAFLSARGWSQEEGLKQLKSVLLSEPMRFGPYLNRSRTLVIVGLFDQVLGWRRSMALWRSMGKPQLILLPTGHYTAGVYTPYLKLTTYSFLRRNLSHA